MESDGWTDFQREKRKALLVQYNSRSRSTSTRLASPTPSPRLLWITLGSKIK